MPEDGKRDCLFVGGPCNGEIRSHWGIALGVVVPEYGKNPNLLHTPGESLDTPAESEMERNKAMIFHYYSRQCVKNERGEVFEIMVYEGIRER